MKKNIIAIDPGAAGGIAVHLIDKSPQFFPMPKTDTDISNLLCKEIKWGWPERTTVYLENLVKHMGLGIPASTMAVYASNWGFIKGVVIACGLRLELITPQAWQKALMLGITGRQKTVIMPGMNAELAKAEKFRVARLNAELKRNWKNKLKAEAQRLYPELAHTITLQTCDAVLILEYGKRKNSESLI